MKTIGLILFVFLLVPIYLLPWVGWGSVVMDVAGSTSEVESMDQQVDSWMEGFKTSAKFWMAEAICYFLLFTTCLIFARGARWTAALVGFAAVFDLLPILDFIPLVPTIMFIVAFVFMAKASPPEAQLATTPT